VQDFKFDSVNEKGCAVYGCLQPVASLRPLKEIEAGLAPLHRPSVTRKIRVSPRDAITTLNGLVIASGCDSVCIVCYNQLKQGKMPKNALANGLWLGNVPPELRDLSWMEQKLIARINTNYYMVPVHSSWLYKMKTNVFCSATPMKKVYNTLPPARNEFEQVLAILFIGPALPSPTNHKRTPLLVRRNQVLDALNWLKLIHVDYADLTISLENLAEYPEDEPLVYVDYHPTQVDTDHEPTAISNIDDEESTSKGKSSFVVHGLTGDQLSDLWKSDDRKTIRMEAIKYFAKGGKALGIGRSEDMESIRDNPQLYPSMFLWLFPYGYGGLGNEQIQIKISDSTRKKQWLMYHDKHFQHDQFFSPIPFNHQQIKNSSDGGYLLTFKHNFPEVAFRLSSIKISTLDSLVSRMKEGPVIPETEDEKMCFRLLNDIDYVATHVDGSVTNRKQMRNEIWSLTSYLGAPSWFITFAPADINHPLVLYYADDNQEYFPSIPSHHDCVLLIANNPVAGARFFKFMVDMFIKHVLGYSNNKHGLYGTTSGYYGTVEEQGRLTLHMHMLIWLKHSLSPQGMRDRIMNPKLDFQQRIVSYLESTHVGEFINSTMDDMTRHIETMKTLNTAYIPLTQTLPEMPVEYCMHTCKKCEDYLKAID
jgi:hypothetical protein